jgi:WD40 repeat protein
MNTLLKHDYAVGSLVWLADGSRFISAAMDARIYIWDLSGTVLSVARTGPTRIVDAALTPDGAKLVLVGVVSDPPPPPSSSTAANGSPLGPAAFPISSGKEERRILVWNMQDSKIER